MAGTALTAAVTPAMPPPLWSQSVHCPRVWNQTRHLQDGDARLTTSAMLILAARNRGASAVAQGRGRGKDAQGRLGQHCTADEEGQWTESRVEARSLRCGSGVAPHRPSYTILQGAARPKGISWICSATRQTLVDPPSSPSPESGPGTAVILPCRAESDSTQVEPSRGESYRPCQAACTAPRSPPAGAANLDWSAARGLQLQQSIPSSLSRARLTHAHDSTSRQQITISWATAHPGTGRVTARRAHTPRGPRRCPAATPLSLAAPDSLARVSTEIHPDLVARPFEASSPGP